MISKNLTKEQETWQLYAPTMKSKNIRSNVMKI